MVSDILQRLRDATAASHKALHEHPTLSALVKKDVNESYYRNALVNFYGFYYGLEHRFADCRENLFKGFEALSALKALEHDLRREHIHFPTVDTLDHPHYACDAEFSAAYLYIREGSNLGGRVISRNLDYCLNKKPGEGNMFFWGHGSETGMMWRSFQSQLADNQVRLDHEKTAAYAATIFESLQEWLDKKEIRDAAAA